jgi:hypothetical protein
MRTKSYKRFRAKNDLWKKENFLLKNGEQGYRPNKDNTLYAVCGKRRML